MPLLPVTTLTAAILGLMLVVLSVRVSGGRLAKRQRGLGDDVLDSRIRTHGNFVEYVPTALILMALVERAGGARFWLEIVATLLIAARLLHVLGMMRPPPNVARGGGAVLTWVVIAWLSIWALLIAIRMLSLQ